MISIMLLSTMITGIFLIKERASAETLLSANQEEMKHFSRAEGRVYKLTVLEEFIEKYDTYKAKLIENGKVTKDYESKISEMRAYFLESKEAFYEREIGKVEFEGIRLMNDKEEIQTAMEALKSQWTLAESEKDLTLGNFDKYRNKASELMEMYHSRLKEIEEGEVEKEKLGKEARGAVESYRKTNQDILEEDDYYKTYIGYVEAGLKDSFSTIKPEDLYLPSIFSTKAEYGYHIMDLDSDGVKELLLGEISEGNHEIYGIYTIKEGKMIRVAEADTNRYCYFLNKDGVVRREGMFSSSSGTWEFYSYKAGELQLLEIIDYDEARNQEGPYFYRTTEEYTTENAIPISNAKKEEILGQYEQVEIEFIPVL